MGKAITFDDMVAIDGKAKPLSKLDLMDYYHIPLSESACDLTSFVAQWGNFRYKKPVTKSFASILGTVSITLSE